jgi:transcriptional regulator with XRE-family HTH domain
MKSNGAAIAAIREGRGLSKSDLARLAAIDLSHLSRIESGQRNGTDTQIIGIARVLLVPVTAIISEAVAS